MRRLVCAALAALSCRGGLYTDKGNDFPCDFSQPEQVRDAVCAPGDVCGVDNRCRTFHYEGPQFEASSASQPSFGTVVIWHPGALDAPIDALTHRGEPDGGLRGKALMGSRLANVVVERDITVTLDPSPIAARDLSAVVLPGGWAVAVKRDGSNDRTFVVQSDGGTAEVMGPGGPVAYGDRVRLGKDKAVLLRTAPMPPSAGEVNEQAMFRLLDFPEMTVLPDGGTGNVAIHPADLRYLPPRPPLMTEDLLVLARDGFFLGRGGGVPKRVQTSDTDLIVPDPTGLFRTELRHDLSGTLVVYALSDNSNARVLSTWRLDRGPQPSITRLWADCSPCRGGRIGAFVPTLDAAPAVEVLCMTPRAPPDESAGLTLGLVRVTGSAAADPAQGCIVEPFDPPFALGQVNLVSQGRRAAEGAGLQVVYDDANGAGILLGGKRGQVWAGPSFSQALPLFLERTPVAFGTVLTPLGPLPLALTDRYVATPRMPGNGFQALDVRAATAALARDVVASALVGQAQGWLVLSNGDTAYLEPGRDLGFGPRLVDGRGAPARAPFFAEGARGPGGGLASFVMTADDSLYFAPVPEKPSATPDELPQMTPQLTPAPSSPIRSFALERSSLTDGVNRVRGYLVAGRSLFLVELTGTPPRWVATPIVLQGGEPLEVWMDHPLGGLGRVGFRDGQVFTMPGGYLLVNELPRSDGGSPPQVLDYENLGGWPVAMTSNGLFEAHYDLLDGGRLDNRFPDGGVGKAMGWREVTLSGGARPWLGRTARLHVFQTGDPGALKVFHLLVYMDDQVLEVGTLTRK